MSQFNLLLCQPTFGPFQVASALGDLAAAAIATVSVASKQTEEPTHSERVTAHLLGLHAPATVPSYAEET